MESVNYGKTKPSAERMKQSRDKALALLAGSEMWILVGETEEEWICSMNGDGASILAMMESIQRTYETTVPIRMDQRTNEEH